MKQLLLAAGGRILAVNGSDSNTSGMAVDRHHEQSYSVAGDSICRRLAPGRLAICLAWLCCACYLSAQDPFEIHIYEYEPMLRGQYSLEAHLNLFAQGTALRDGTLLATRRQTHLTFEPTFGVSETFALGFMFLHAWEPGYSPQFAGWRVLPHFYAPKSWELPVQLGFVAEFSFQKDRYEENTGRVELRPIIDKGFSRWQIVFNPVFERALHGPGDLQVSPALMVNMGLGFDVAGQGPGIVIKSRFEWQWGRD